MPTDGGSREDVLVGPPPCVVDAHLTVSPALIPARVEPHCNRELRYTINNHTSC